MIFLFSTVLNALKKKYIGALSEILISFYHPIADHLSFGVMPVPRFSLKPTIRKFQIGYEMIIIDNIIYFTMYIICSIIGTTIGFTLGFLFGMWLTDLWNSLYSLFK